MKRRQFIKTLLPGGITVCLGTGGAIWLMGNNNRPELSIEAAFKQLDRLASRKILHLGEWNPHQIFTHCAQSIEYSMLGFPEHKSTLFKNTVGQLAFSVFAYRGKMTHGLSEPIPGAPLLAREEHDAAQLSVQNALARLKQALIDFHQYQGELAPHFAYGKLSKEEYQLAHLMHLNNHLEEITS